MRFAGNQGYVHGSVFAEKSFEQIGIAMAYLHVFLITMHEIDTAAEVYLEPFPTYMFELFCKNSQRLKKKGSILTGIVLNTPCRRYKYSISYYNKDETRALHSSEVQVKH